MCRGLTTYGATFNQLEDGNHLLNTPCFFLFWSILWLLLLSSSENLRWIEAPLAIQHPCQLHSLDWLFLFLFLTLPSPLFLFLGVISQNELLGQQILSQAILLGDSKLRHSSSSFTSLNKLWLPNLNEHNKCIYFFQSI